MFDKVTPEKAIAFTRFSIALCCAWPLSSDATKAQVLRYRFLRVAAGLSAMGLFLPVSYAMYLNYGDADVFANTASMIIATTHIMVQVLVFSLLQDRFRLLIEDLTSFCENMQSYEKRVVQRYVDKYSKFYGWTVTWFYMCSVVVILGSLLDSTQTFPTVSEYPFSVDYMPVKITIFLHQSVVSFQCSSAVSANMFGALLLLYSAAKFEILTIDFRAATTVEALTDCLKKYYAVTRYTWQVVSGVQYVAFATILINSVIIVFCGYNLIGRQMIIVYMQLIFIVGTSLLEVLMWAIPADHLMEMSEKVTRGAYEATWYEQGLTVQKTVLRIMMPQKPMKISLKCFVPNLNLDYFCSVSVPLISSY
ncbi:uncharacterized protein LOC116429558 isoform X2 [Nomia melanderi]|uniref:uncharacterized protein LOC116429558 isoform X2 n=1 Tax=Nomia melanderi TaxID=2448451 RepID=UPI003FCE3191